MVSQVSCDLRASTTTGNGAAKIQVDIRKVDIDRIVVRRVGIEDHFTHDQVGGAGGNTLRSTAAHRTTAPARGNEATVVPLDPETKSVAAAAQWNVV